MRVFPLFLAVLIGVMTATAQSQQKVLPEVTKIEFSSTVMQIKDGSPVELTLNFRSSWKPSSISGNFSGPEGAKFGIFTDQIEEISSDRYKTKFRVTLSKHFYSGNYVLQELRFADGLNQPFLDKKVVVVVQVINFESNGLQPEKPRYTVKQKKMPNGDTHLQFNYRIWSGTPLVQVLGNITCTVAENDFFVTAASAEKFTKGRKRGETVIAEYRAEESSIVKKGQFPRGKCRFYGFHALGENGLSSESPDDQEILIK